MTLDDTLVQVTYIAGQIWCLYWLRTLVHEAGHYLAARALGMGTARVTVWNAPWLVHTTLPDGTGLRIGVRTWGGCVMFDRSWSPSRRRVVPVVLAGPGLELLVVPAVTYLTYDRTGVTSLAFAALALFSLVPLRAKKGELPCDGRVLLRCWRSYRRGARAPVDSVR